MKRKVIKLTESDLTKIVKRVIAEQEQSVPRSTKGSLIDIAKKEASNKPQLTGYKWTQNPEYIWEIINSNNVKVGGALNPSKGKQFKSKDFIQLLKEDGELTFAPKGDNSVMFSVDMGSNGIRVNAHWD